MHYRKRLWDRLGRRSTSAKKGTPARGRRRWAGSGGFARAGSSRRFTARHQPRNSHTQRPPTCTIFTGIRLQFLGSLLPTPWSRYWQRSCPEHRCAAELYPLRNQGNCMTAMKPPPHWQQRGGAVILMSKMVCMAYINTAICFSCRIAASTGRSASKPGTARRQKHRVRYRSSRHRRNSDIGVLRHRQNYDILIYWCDSDIRVLTIS